MQRVLWNELFKEDNYMITFSILMIVLTVLAVIIAACGASLLVAFGDLIVCGLIIALIVKLFKPKKEKEKQAQ